MKRFLLSAILAVLIWACTERGTSNQFTSVKISDIYQDSISIRAIEFLDKNTLAFAGSNGIFGTVAVNSGKVRIRQMVYDSIIPEFRAVGHTSTDFFMLSVGNPALLYKTGDNGLMELVYMEEGEGVFYDAMAFWNDTEGIAVGDSRQGCLSLITTRDGGHTWNKLSCSQLPEAEVGEGAFAASNTNIAIKGDYTWIATTTGRIYFSPDRGGTWEIQEVPIVNKKSTEGIYSLDFYDKDLGIAFGGDYTLPMDKRNTKAMTTNGGSSWRTIANGDSPGYKSCVQFIPNTGGQGIVALGFTGIAYSGNRGETWKELSKESFYTLRFLNDSTALAAGKGRISKLLFK